jgi:hypothetical protein
MSFVHGSSEVRVNDILDRNKAFWTLADKEACAQAYERKHPGTVVVRDWETAEETERRRAGRNPLTTPSAPTLGMDPERAAKELKRVYANIAGLDRNHADFDRLWRNYTDFAHQLEDICSIERTKFSKTAEPRKSDEPIPKELQDKLNAYVLLPVPRRRKNLEMLENATLLRLFRDNEPIAELQEIAITRLAQIGAL